MPVFNLDSETELQLNKRLLNKWAMNNLPVVKPLFSSSPPGLDLASDRQGTPGPKKNMHFRVNKS